MVDITYWKNKCYGFSEACTKWGAPQEMTDIMNKAITKCMFIDTELYERCKYSAEYYLQNYLKNTRGRKPRSDEMKKMWHSRIAHNIKMQHPDTREEL